MPDWSIQIVAGANPGDPATFVSQNQPSAPVGTLFADPGDAVSWDNATTEDHLPMQTNLVLPIGGLLWDRVTPGHQTAAWVVPHVSAGTAITYTCLLHPLEQGKIQVT
jgi:hypothetical protein